MPFATGRPALFVGFIATMAECDFSRPFIAGYGSSPSPHGPARWRSRPAGHRPPGSLNTESLRTCQGLRPRRTEGRSRNAPPLFAFRSVNGVGIRKKYLSRLNGWPMRTPADASDLPSRTSTHGSGATWLATPSSQWTSTFYSLPVSPAPLTLYLTP